MLWQIKNGSTRNVDDDADNIWNKYTYSAIILTA